MLHVLFDTSVEQRVKAREQGIKANYRLYSCCCCCFCQTDFSYYNTNTYIDTYRYSYIYIYVCVSSCVKLVYSALVAADAVDLISLYTYIYIYMVIGPRINNNTVTVKSTGLHI